jgi:hypothetical protein
MQSIAQETRYRLEVRALGGDGWRPAVAGSLNQTRWSDEEASEFETPESALAFAEAFIRPEGEVEAIRIVRVSDGLAVCTVEDLPALGWRDGERGGVQP